MYPRADQDENDEVQGVPRKCNETQTCSFPATKEQGVSAPFRGVNMRDVGAVNSAVKRGRLFRSSEVFCAAEMERCGIKTVLDLRRVEHQCTSPSYRDKSLQQGGDALNLERRTTFANKAWVFCIPLQGFGRHRHQTPYYCLLCKYNLQKDFKIDISIVHADLIPLKVGLSIFQALPVKIQLNAIGAACFGKGADSVLTPAIADDDIYGYKALYRTILQESKTGMAIAFRTLANPHSYPVLVHCVHGKDRTGLVVMLLLMLAGVSKKEILEDYAASEEALKRSRRNDELHLKDFLTTDEVISANKDALNDAISFISSQYDGAAGYLSRAGLDRREIDSIRANIIRQLC